MHTQARQLSLFDAHPDAPAGIEADPKVIAFFGQLPERLLMMHHNFGTLPGQQCFCCKFFWTKPGVDHRECLWYHNAKGEKTNWIASWPACGKRESGDAHAEAHRQGRE